MNTQSRPPRFAMFTHDTFGLGHVRRCLHIVRALAERVPQAPILFISGTPALKIFDELPANADFLKIPTIAKTGSKRFRPPHLPLPLNETTELRSRLIREALAAFDPDIVLVDNFPLGSRGELLSVLEALRTRRARTLLGLRDILDAPDVVRSDWSRQGIYEVLDRHYDRILVYGMREIFDLEEAYALPSPIAAKLRYCGYVTAPSRPSKAEAELDLAGQYLLATGGGGGDAYPLLSTFVEALPLMPEMPAAIFTGPLMNGSQRAELRARLNGRADVFLRDYVPDLRRYMAAAKVVVSMCGYNTAAEIVASGARAVVVPRNWRYGEHAKGTAAGVEWEQLMRARSLSRLGRVRLLEPEELNPETLAACITDAAASPGRAAERMTAEPRVNGHSDSLDPLDSPPELDVGGLDRVADNILSLVEGQEG